MTLRNYCQWQLKWAREHKGACTFTTKVSFGIIFQCWSLCTMASMCHLYWVLWTRALGWSCTGCSVRVEVIIRCCSTMTKSRNFLHKATNPSLILNMVYLSNVCLWAHDDSNTWKVFCMVHMFTACWRCEEWRRVPLGRSPHWHWNPQGEGCRPYKVNQMCCLTSGSCSAHCT